MPRIAGVPRSRSGGVRADRALSVVYLVILLPAAASGSPDRLECGRREAVGQDAEGPCQPRMTDRAP